MSVSSERLMGILVLDDVLSNNVTVNTGNSFTLQHFDYKCERARSGAGNPFGTETPSYLHFTVKVADNVTGSEFLERMRQAETFSYSFLFNTDQAYTIVAYGYMVELEEIHDSVLLENGEEEQMLIKCTILLSSLTFESSDNKHLKLKITND